MGLIPAKTSIILSWRLSMKNFIILPLPLTQEGQLSVSGKRICTGTDLPIRGLTYSVKVWLGKLTGLT